jgi:hypothetical protein
VSTKLGRHLGRQMIESRLPAAVGHDADLRLGAARCEAMKYERTPTVIKSSQASGRSLHTAA